MGIEKIKLFIDFDDVIIKTSPRLEEQLLKAYKYASLRYWHAQIEEAERIYLTKISDLRKKGKTSQHVADSAYLDELYESEMNTYTEYVRTVEELEENARYIGINIDYVLEVLNNGNNYVDGDNPNSPYYIDYNIILDMCYAIPNSFEFLRTVINSQNIIASILSQKNCDRESIRKIELINENVGDMPVHLIDFHTDPFSTGKRHISSKAEYVMNLYGIDQLDETFILIDDNKQNIIDWIAHGGKGILYSPIKCEGFKWQMHEMTYEAFMTCIDEGHKKLIKGKSL